MNVTIYHQTGAGRFREFDPDTSTITKAYEYDDADLDGLNIHALQERLWRTNNAVDGSERNVAAGARSLSVGDVVGLRRHRTDKAEEFWAVESFGWAAVFEADVLIAEGRA
jgi:hypothetical protein